MKIALYGGNGYAGEAIRAEALRRGHDVAVLSRTAKAASDDAAAQTKVGDIHDALSIDEVTLDSDVVIVSIPGYEIDGKKVADAIPALLEAAARNDARIGVVGGSGTLKVSEGGARLMDTPDFPPPALPSSLGQADVLAHLEAASSGRWFYVSPPLVFGARFPQEPAGAYLLGADVLIKDSQGQARLGAADLALAVLDEIEKPRHENSRFSVVGAY